MNETIKEQLELKTAEAYLEWSKIKRDSGGEEYTLPILTRTKIDNRWRKIKKGETMDMESCYYRIAETSIMDDLEDLDEECYCDKCLPDDDIAFDEDNTEYDLVRIVDLVITKCWWVTIPDEGSFKCTGYASGVYGEDKAFLFGVDWYNLDELKEFEITEHLEILL